MVFISHLLMGILTFYGVAGKSINLKMDSDDVVQILKNLIGSDIVKNFANHVYRRSIGAERGYNNPYHPEDELTSFFDAALVETVLNYKKNFRPQTTIDNFEKENDRFTNVHIKEDILTNNVMDNISKLSEAENSLAQSDTRDSISVNGKKVIQSPQKRYKYQRKTDK